MKKEVTQQKEFRRSLAGSLVSLLIMITVFFGLGELTTRMAMGLLHTPAAESRETYNAKLDDIQARSYERLLKRVTFIPDHVSDQTYQHPYAGFIPRPDLASPCGPAFSPVMCVTNKPRSINPLGLYENEFSFVPKQGTVRIGILGSSVANLFMQTSADLLIKDLNAYPAFSGKKLEVLNLAIPGFKQPQPANMLLYLISLGYRFDAIINIGGLNEIYLSRRWNIPNNMSYAYPYGAHWFPSPPPASRSTNGISSPQLIGAETSLDALTVLAPREALAHSAFIRWVTLKILGIAENRVQKALQKSGVSGSDALLKPSDHDYLYASEANKKCREPLCVNERVQLWEAGAVASATLLQHFGTRYFEVLQPNHYVVDPSMISDADMKLMKADDFGWLQTDTDAWNMMRLKLAGLQKEGVQTADFSEPYIFTGLSSSLVDTCCHLTKEGYDRLAERLAQTLAQSWQ